MGTHYNSFYNFDKIDQVNKEIIKDKTNRVLLRQATKDG